MRAAPARVRCPSTPTTLCLALLTLGPGWAATFSETPPIVSNTYAGAITLQVGGLTNGETVVVERFLDANTNGVIDGADWLVQSFRLTDGQASVIAGVTNVNVPGDTDAVAGAITAQVSFPFGGFGQQFVGRYYYRLSSPSGRFTPVTNAFSVTNTAYVQGFSGAVRSSGTNVPYAGVLVFAPSGGEGLGNPVAGVVADGSGNYTVNVPPGLYLLWATRSGYVSDITTAPLLRLGAGSTIVTNLVLLPANRTISGRTADATNTAVGLPGLLGAWQSTNNLLATAFTDSDGNFTATVTPSLWQFGGDEQPLALHGYMAMESGQRVDTSTGSVANVLVTFTKGTSLLYGDVKDEQSRALAGVTLYGEENYGNGPFHADAAADQTGRYVMAVSAGLWWVNIERVPAAYTNYVHPQPPDWTNLTDGVAVRQDFIFRPATNHITGTVVDANTNPVANIRVSAYAMINGTTYNAIEATTDPTGHYWLNVCNGAWTVGLFNLQNLGLECTNNYQPVTISNNNGIANFNVQPCGPLQVVTPSPLPGGQVGVFYGVQLEATGCNQPFNWSLAPGSGPLPGGLNLYSDGSLSGIPSATGTFVFTVRVTDNNSQTADQPFSLTIGDNAGLQVTTTVLPNGTVGAGYDAQLAASGGQPPYQWSLAPASANLPPGLALAGNGVISGTPTNSGIFPFTVRVTDSVLNTADAPLAILISAPGAVTLTVKSDVSTLATALGSGPPSAPAFTRLDNGDASGLSFQGALVGDFGTFTPVPPGAPAGTQVINIPPGDGENGFFKVTFVLPGGVRNIGLAGVANADDYGRAFLNGHPLSGSMTNPGPGVITETGNATFSTANPGWFLPGTNELVLADANTGGGPSGAAFYALITYQPGLTLTAPTHRSNGQFEFSFLAHADENYTVQYSTNLTNWTDLVTFSGGAEAPITVVDTSAAGSDRRFYRVRIGP